MSNDVVQKLEANVAAFFVSKIPATATETELENQLEFPMDAFGENPIGRMAQKVARVCGVPPKLPYMLGLAVVSIAMQRAFQIRRAFDRPRYWSDLALPLDAAYSYLVPHYENKHLHHIKYSNRKYWSPRRTGFPYF